MADRRARAQQALQQGTERATDWLTAYATSVADMRDALDDGLRDGAFSRGRLLTDAWAISINAWSAVVKTPSAATVVSRPVAARDSLVFVFDRSSEFSGPVPVTLPEGFDPLTTTGTVAVELSGPGGVIPRHQVEVLDNRAIFKVMLVSLQNPSPLVGVYEGTLQLTSGSKSVTMPFRATCVDKLWWRDG